MAIITLINASAHTVVLSTMGAGILSINVPDKNGTIGDIVMGYQNIDDYKNDGPCAGKTAGRYANRIAHGHFSLGGKDYTLPVNCGPHHLHGGPDGCQNQDWELLESSDSHAVMGIRLPDGHAGYPGNLDIRVRYHWSDDSRLTIAYEAETDAPTVVNLTNHTYFNLDGHDAGTALGHLLWLNAGKYLPTDPTLVPTGEFASVDGTPMDFTTPKLLGQDIDSNFDAIKYGKGYDACWLINGETGELREVAILVGPKSNRKLTIMSTQPGVQVYTGNWLTGSPMGKGGYAYSDYDCVALECQGLPDAPNKPSFPSQELRPGETYKHTIIYKFDTND